MSIAEQSPIEFPTARESVFDPAPELAEMRARHPLCPMRYPDGEVGWLVTGHELARRVLTDARFGMRLKLPVGNPEQVEAAFDVFRQIGIADLLDPPAHTRWRRLLAPYFSVRRMDEFRPAVERIVAAQLDAIEAAGSPADLVRTFAAPVALSVHCVLLGVPESDAGHFAQLAESLFDPSSSPEGIRQSFDQFCAYLRPLLDQKRLEPGGDLISDIVANGQLADDETFSIAAFLFIAGRTTVANMIAVAIFALLAHPSQREAMCSDSALVPRAVEELLRYATIFQAGALPRLALEDLQLDETTVKRGEHVTVALAAANRDPARYEHPDALDVGRSETGHLAFGQGAHMCVGQHLARVELQVALQRLFERFPSLRLAVSVEDVPLYSGDQPDFGVHELPVEWGPR